MKKGTELVERNEVHTVVNIDMPSTRNPDKLLRLRRARYEQPDLLCEEGVEILQVEAKQGVVT